jgi:hypothetical protein
VGDLPDTRGGVKDVLIILAVLGACVVSGIVFWASLDEPKVGYGLWFLAGLVWAVQIARSWSRRRRGQGSS